MSTTAEKLNQLSLDKSAIKTAIEAKKGTALATPNDFGTYAPEIDSIVLGEVKPEYGSEEWYYSQRNPNWLDIKNLITEADRAIGKIVMLMPVYRSGAFLRYRNDKALTIDYGDGTVVSRTGSLYYDHTYDFDSIDSPILADDTKQVIVTVVGSTDIPLKYFMLYSKGHQKCSSPLEILAIGDFTYLRTSSVAEMMELFKLDGKIVSTDTFYTCVGYARQLKFLQLEVKSKNFNNYAREYVHRLKLKIDLTDATNITYMFYKTLFEDFSMVEFVGALTIPVSGAYMYSLTASKHIPALDYKLLNSFYLFLYSNVNIVDTPLLDMTNSANNKRFAESCLNLVTVNIINCKASIGFKRCYRLPLSEIIKFGLSGIVDLTGKTSQEVDITDSAAEQQLKDLGDDGTYSYSGTDYTKSQILSIFIDKNWTLKY